MVLDAVRGILQSDALYQAGNGFYGQGGQYGDHHENDNHFQGGESGCPSPLPGGFHGAMH
jgi:hypothetical protein